MTAQIKDRLFYKEKNYGMATEPLHSFLKDRKDIDFSFRSTACWRGYIGQWKIKEKKLYLIHLQGWVKKEGEVDLSYLFPDQNKVFASWFSDDIILPHGELIKYVHMGYESIFEKDLILSFKNGVLIDERIIDNR